MADFLSENYVWLIVVGVFIIMVIIGYFADKAQNSDKSKKTKLKDHVDELDDNTENEDIKIDEWEDKPVPKEEDEVIEVKGLDNSFDSWDTSLDSINEEEKKEEANSEESPEEPKEEIPESNDEAAEEAEVEPAEEEVIPEVEELAEEEKEEAPIKEVEEQPIEELEEEKKDEAADPIEDLEITLPNIDTLNEEIKDVVDAEDVWKF